MYRAIAGYWVHGAVGAVIAMSAVPCIAQTAEGTTAGDPAAGSALAQAWCSECHEIGAGPSPGEPSLLPAFRDIARERTLSEIGFRAFLQTPHGGMPNIMVSHEQAGDLYAYIASLRNTKPMK